MLKPSCYTVFMYSSRLLTGVLSFWYSLLLCNSCPKVKSHYVARNLEPPGFCYHRGCKMFMCLFREGVEPNSKLSWGSWGEGRGGRGREGFGKDRGSFDGPDTRLHQKYLLATLQGMVGIRLRSASFGLEEPPLRFWVGRPDFV